MNNFSINLSLINIDENSYDYILNTYNVITKDDSNIYNKYIDMYIKDEKFEDIFTLMNKDLKSFNIHEYTLNFILLIVLLEPLKNKYKEHKINLDLYLSIIQDLRYKLNECIKVYNIIGTFVYWWYERIYNLNIYKIGRLEYELIKFDKTYTNGKLTFNKGDNAISIHIPNTGEKLTKESVIESFKVARDYFKSIDKNYDFVLCSWIIYTKNIERYKEGSNLYNFSKMFDVYFNIDSDTYSELWRIFDTVVDTNNLDRLPRNTYLQRTFIDVIKKNEKIGAGFGILKEEYQFKQ